MRPPGRWQRSTHCSRASSRPGRFRSQFMHRVYSAVPCLLPFYSPFRFFGFFSFVVVGAAPAPLSSCTPALSPALLLVLLVHLVLVAVGAASPLARSSLPPFPLFRFLSFLPSGL
eukprot:364322-Chlamydomonas_euryale.AAC.1